MKRTFRPYLDIVSDSQLKILLNNQRCLRDNMFPVSQIKEFSEKGFRDLVERFKNFYRYRPKAEYAEYINDIIYHLIVAQFYLNQFGMSSLAGPKDFLQAISEAGSKKLKEICDNEDEEERKDDIKSFRFLIDDISKVNCFIVKHFGENFYTLKEYTLEEFLEITFDEYIELLNEFQTKVFILANRINHFRLKMIIFNLVSYRLSIPL